MPVRPSIHYNLQSTMPLRIGHIVVEVTEVIFSASSRGWLNAHVVTPPVAARGARPSKPAVTHVVSTTNPPAWFRFYIDDALRRLPEARERK